MVNSAYLHSTGPIYVWVQFPSASMPPPQSQPTAIAQGVVPPTPIPTTPAGRQLINQGGGNGKLVGVSLPQSTSTASLGIYYVGTCEEFPVSEGSITYDPIYTSTGGARNPTDKTYEGASEILVLDLNDYDANVVDYLESAPKYGRNVSSLQGGQFGPIVPTITRRLDRGSLLVRNLGFYQIWLAYSFFGTANATPDLPPGWFYYCCSTGGVYISRQGTQNKKRRLIIEAMELQDPNGWYWAVKTNQPAQFVNVINLKPPAEKKLTPPVGWWKQEGSP